MRQKALLIATLLTILLFGIVLLLPKSSKLLLESSSPTNNATNTKTNKPLVLTFTQPLDADSPFKTIDIAPKTDVSVDVDSKTITIVPKNQFRQEATYTITIKGLLAANGSSIETLKQTFTTGKRTLTEFEKSLPYSGTGFTIEQLGDASIVVIVYGDDTTKAIDDAKAYLQKNGIDPATVSFGSTSTVDQ